MAATERAGDVLQKICNFGLPCENLAAIQF
jgi:hypothetical protein